jgi:hypothetical protein
MRCHSKRDLRRMKMKDIPRGVYTDCNILAFAKYLCQGEINGLMYRSTHENKCLYYSLLCTDQRLVADCFVSISKWRHWPDFHPMSFPLRSFATATQVMVGLLCPWERLSIIDHIG